MNNSLGRISRKGEVRSEPNRKAGPIRIKPSGCHLWLGKENGSGEGMANIDGKQVSVRRHIYESEIGSVPKGYEPIAKCCLRTCVAPNHLFLGRQSDNNINNLVRDLDWFAVLNFQQLDDINVYKIDKQLIQRQLRNGQLVKIVSTLRKRVQEGNFISISPDFTHFSTDLTKCLSDNEFLGTLLGGIPRPQNAL